MEDAAIEGYRAGRLTQRQVGAMLGLDYWQTETFLYERAVPLNYSAADLPLTTPRWKKSSPARERRRLGHFAVALPHFVRRGNHFAAPFPPSGDSADCFPRTSTAEHAAARASMGGFIAGLGCRPIA